LKEVCEIANKQLEATVTELKLDATWS
jgi:hypothetical protein